MTSSKRSRFLRISKLRASTLPCAVSSALLSQRWVSASSSAMPFFCTQSSTLLLPKMRIRSSSSDRKNFDAPGSPGLGHDLGFLVVEAGVQHAVRDLALLQLLRQRLGLLDRYGADQHGLLTGAAFLDQLDDGARLVGHRAVDLVVGVLAHHRHIG